MPESSRLSSEFDKTAKAEWSVWQDQHIEGCLARIPGEVLGTFSGSQLDAISTAFRGVNQKHKVDFRVSVPWFGQRHYAVLLFGRERRSLERLRREGQVTVGKIAGTYSAAAAIIASLMFMSGLACVYCVNALMSENLNEARSSPVCVYANGL